MAKIADRRRDGQRAGSAPRSGPAPARRRGARRCRPSARGSTAGAPSALRTTVTCERDPRLAAVGAQVALLGAVGVQLAGRRARASPRRRSSWCAAWVTSRTAHPGELPRLAAQHRRQRAVDAHEAPVGAGDRHADRRRPRRRAGSAPRRRAAPSSAGRCRCSRRVSRSMPDAARGTSASPVSGEPKRSASSSAVGTRRQQLPATAGGGAGEVLGVQHIADRAPEQLLDRHADALLERRGRRKRMIPS